MGATDSDTEHMFEGIADEASPALSHVGRELGDYRLLQLIGEGGMGWVYLARHSRIGRRVAIKMLRPELATDPVAVRRFFAEARAVNRIQHDNIVQVHDFVEDQGGFTYLVLELLIGRDLLALMERQGPLPLARSLGIMTQAAQALAEVHACGVVHRDLKPENFFLVEHDGRPDVVKLLDFGIAKLRGAGPSSRLTRAGTSLGTPDYISPEQALGADVDHRADIYSFGVILYELITARRPFASDDVTLTIARQVTEVPTRPSALPVQVGAIPPALDELVMHCLAKRPSERPESMTVVEAILRQILDTLDRPEEWAPATASVTSDASPRPPAIELDMAEVAPAPPAPPPIRALRLRQIALAAAGLAGAGALLLALHGVPVEKPAAAGGMEPAIGDLPGLPDGTAEAAVLPAAPAAPALAGPTTTTTKAPAAKRPRRRSSARPPSTRDRRSAVLPVYFD